MENKICCAKTHCTNMVHYCHYQEVSPNNFRNAHVDRKELKNDSRGYVEEKGGADFEKK